MQQMRSNNRVLDYLMQKKIEGKLPGVLGRLVSAKCKPNIGSEFVKPLCHISFIY